MQTIWPVSFSKQCHMVRASTRVCVRACVCVCVCVCVGVRVCVQVWYDQGTPKTEESAAPAAVPHQAQRGSDSQLRVVTLCKKVKSIGTPHRRTLSTLA